MQTTLLKRLAVLIHAHSKGLGFLPSPVPGVVLMHMDRHLPSAPTVYDPCIVIVAQGYKVGSFNGRRYVYDAHNCLTLTLPLPFETETFGSAEEPFLGLAISITPAMVAALLIQMDFESRNEDIIDAIASVPMDDDLLSAAVRLVESMEIAERARIFGPDIVRELIYFLLRGPYGTTLRSFAVGSNWFGRVAKVIQRLQSNFDENHEVAALAQEAGMGLTAFHAHFKAATGETPLQYLKLIRLHKARELMVNEGLRAQTAAIRVGYESASQFGREFKRLFGGSPALVTTRLRHQLDEARETHLRATLSFEQLNVQEPSI